MSERLELCFGAPTAADAQRQARQWVAAEPRLRLKTICSVRPRSPQDTDLDAWGEPRWTVVVSVEAVR
jgi:hypothetical protein